MHSVGVMLVWANAAGWLQEAQAEPSIAAESPVPPAAENGKDRLQTPTTDAYEPDYSDTAESAMDENIDEVDLDLCDECRAKAKRVAARTSQMQSSSRKALRGRRGDSGVAAKVIPVRDKDSDDIQSNEI